MIRLTRSQVREIDRRTIGDYGLPGVVLMENAARAVADEAMHMLDGGDALILCGGGNNGGDGLAVARMLHNRGVFVRILHTIPVEKWTGDAAVQWRVVKAMGLPAGPWTPTAVGRPALVVDAIFGIGLNRPPREPFGEIVDSVRSSTTRVLSIDVPSGLECDSGLPLGPCMKADVTVTFVAEKVGFDRPEARAVLGRVVVGDIGCPRELWINEKAHGVAVGLGSI